MERRLCLELLVVVLLSAAALGACGGDKDRPAEATTAAPTQPTAAPATAPPAAESPPGGVPWERIPLYAGAELEASEVCAPQWAECVACEHRVYASADDPQKLCAFYEEQMAGQGWHKLAFQSYQEGSCLGTWLDSAAGLRVLMTVAQRRGDEQTFAAVTLARGCP